MRARYAVSLIAVFFLAGCDRITGAADQKILDAESVGYACRASKKSPEDCMKENETHSPTYLLNGWKAADRDINEKVLDPTMGAKAAADVVVSAASNPVVVAHSAPVAAKVESKAAIEKHTANPATKATAKPAKPDNGKPVKTPAHPVKTEPEKKPTT